MALPPILANSSEDDFQVKASFPNGRYRFSLTSSGRQHLVAQLGLEDGDVVPWTVFQLLVVGGDAYLPNATDDSDEIVSDLAVPDDRNELTDRQAEAAVAHLERGSYRDSQLTEIAAIIEETPVGALVSTEQLPSRREKVDGLREIATGLEDSSTPSAQPEPSSDRLDQANESVGDETKTEVADEQRKATGQAALDDNDPIRVLNIGTATLGRRNLSRAVRQADYLDAFSQAIHIAIDESVDAVIQSGQFFQHRSPPESAIRGTRDALEQLAANDIPFYLTYSSKEQEIDDGRVDSLVDDGLLKPIGGKSVSIDGRVCFCGVDAGLPDEQLSTLESVPNGPEFTGTVVETGRTSFSDAIGAVEAATDAAPSAYIVGGVDEYVATGRGTTPVFGPGPTENTLGKRVITRGDLPERGVALYTIDGGGIDAEFRELETRSYTTVTLDLSPEVDTETIKRRLSRLDVRETAVLVRLTGSKDDTAVAAKTVRSILERDAFCVRVWDERTEVDANQEEPETDDNPEERTPEASSDPRSNGGSSPQPSSDLTAQSPTLLCVGDLQLGESMEPLERAVQFARTHKVDAIVHTGDLFDAVSPEEELLLAIERVLAQLEESPTRFFAIAGRRAVATDGDPLERLETSTVLERLGPKPTDVGSIALYGIDHVISDLPEQLQDEPFSWASGASHAICCLNQSIWPAVGTRENAHAGAYEVANAIEPYLHAIVGGGTRHHHDWQGDELTVVYPGTANPELIGEDQSAPFGVVVDGSDDQELQYTTVELTERTATDPSAVTVALETQPSGTSDSPPTDTSNTPDDPADNPIDFAPSDQLEAIWTILMSDSEPPIKDLETAELIDRYGLVSKAKAELESQRKAVRDELLDRTDPESTLDGRYATVDHTERTRQSLRDPDRVLEAMARHGVDPETVRSFDVDRVRETMDDADRSFDNALTTMLEAAGIEPTEATVIDADKVAAVVDERGLDPEAVFEMETRNSIVRKSVELDGVADSENTE